MLSSRICTQVLIKITTRIRGPAHGNETEWDVRTEKPLWIWIGKFGGVSALSLCHFIHLCALFLACSSIW